MKIHKKLPIIGPLLLGATLLVLLFGSIQKASADPIGLTDAQILGMKFTLITPDIIQGETAGQTIQFKKDVCGIGYTTQFSDDISCGGKNSGAKNSNFCLADKHGAFENVLIYTGGDTVGVYLDAGTQTGSSCHHVVDPKTQVQPFDAKITLNNNQQPPPTAPGYVFTSGSIDQITDADLSFQDGGNIILTFKGQTIKYHDIEAENSKPWFTPEAGKFCKDKIGDLKFNDANREKESVQLTDFPVAYYDLANGNTCKTINLVTGSSDIKGRAFSIANPGSIATKRTNWGVDANTIGSISPESKNTWKHVDGDKTGKVFAGAPNASDCGGWAIILSDDNHGVFYYGSGSISNIDPAIANCSFGKKQNVIIDGARGQSSGGTCADGSTPATATGKCADGSTPTGGATGSNDACYHSGWEWSWAACPIITAAQTTANGMYNFVEDQLKFCVARNKTDTTTCKGGDSLGKEHDSVHQVWSNFRILVSGLVVVLLLVMVISQAIGTGPFDAYTVKKMLPRLVIGVILIQISWPIFSWVINTVDDLGRGLADIMYAPFGGSEALNLNSVMKPFVIQGEVFSWVGIPALAVFAVVAPFIVIGLILTVLVAIFVGFLTLLFRKIIIILALIFVPVALISWMMPNDGLRKYWKLWWDNFIKALMMFPLIVAMIAAGRIFAKIGSGQGGDFVGFFIVLVGFFGPLFILPKTFKWGGTLMQSAGSTISSAGQKGLKKPKEFLGERQKGYSAERTRQSQERYQRNVGFNWRAPWRRPIDLVKSGQFDPTLGTGRIAIFGRQIKAASRRREQAMRGYRGAGAESEEADIKAANQDFGQLATQAESHDELARLVAGARVGQSVSFRNKAGQMQSVGRVSAAMKRAGMNAIVKYGTDANMRTLDSVLDQLKHGSAEEQIMADRFLDANAPELTGRMNHQYRGRERLTRNAATGTLGGAIVSRVSALAPKSFLTMEGAEMEALLTELTDAAQDPIYRADAERHLQTIYSNYEQAIDNNTISPHIQGGVNLALKAAAEGNPALAAIMAGNGSRTDTRDGRQATATPLHQMPTLGAMATSAGTLISTVSGRIDPITGVIH